MNNFFLLNIHLESLTKYLYQIIIWEQWKTLDALYTETIMYQEKAEKFSLIIEKKGFWMFFCMKFRTCGLGIWWRWNGGMISGLMNHLQTMSHIYVSMKLLDWRNIKMLGVFSLMKASGDFQKTRKTPLIQFALMLSTLWLLKIYLMEFLMERGHHG